MVLFEKRPAKLVLYVHSSEESIENEEAPQRSEDETDRIPRKLTVEKYQLICFTFSILSYLMDLFSDVSLGIAHWKEGRQTSALFIFLFVFVPSFVLNMVSFAWYCDDLKQRKRNGQTGTPQLHINCKVMALLCFFQLGPIWWHIKALYFAWAFRKETDYGRRRRLFGFMIEAERDATLLRLFEGFLEAAPQLIVQSTMLADFLSNKYIQSHSFWNDTPYWVYMQLGSMSLSILSLCWAITSQHGTIRMVRCNKVNIHPIETFMQLIWRTGTIGSRVIVITLAVLFLGFYSVAAAVVHFILSLLHVSALQSVDTSLGSGAMEVGLLVVNAFMHLFAPFNIAEGPTRYRYITSYLLEAMEALALFFFVDIDDSFELPFKRIYIYVASGLFGIGITTMIIYYQFLHPNRRRHKRITTTTDATDDAIADL